jgi:hypothetical protein
LGRSVIFFGYGTNYLVFPIAFQADDEGSIPFTGSNLRAFGASVGEPASDREGGRFGPKTG